MSIRPRSAQLTLKLISALLVITILASSILPPPLARGLPAAMRPDQAEAAADSGGPVLPTAGRLQFSPVVDTDENPASNPTPAVPAPVHRVGVPGSAEAVKFATLALAVEVLPDSPSQNPAGTVVTFRLWNERGDLAMVREARSDAWGAAFSEFALDDLHLAGRFYYSASAPGFGVTERRAFTFDHEQFLSDTQLGAARLTTSVAADGRLVAMIESDVPVDDSPSAVALTAVRLTSNAEGGLDKELMPTLYARRLDDSHARAEIYLDPGDYYLSASVNSGRIVAESVPVMVNIENVIAPPIATVEQVGAVSADLSQATLLYRTPDGDAALMTQPVSELDEANAEPLAAMPAIFEQSTRIGPYQYRTDIYQMTLDVTTDDGNKRARLSDFAYDPMARTYEIEIQSLLDEAIEDTITVQVYGPNKVVIYEETNPIWLDPDQPLHYKVSVPSELGEPYGLRVIVHDPLDFSSGIEKIQSIITAVFVGTLAAARYYTDFAPGRSTLAATFKFNLDVLKIDLAVASVMCNPECQIMPLKGVFFKPEDWVVTVTNGIRDFVRETYKEVGELDSIDDILAKVKAGIKVGTLSLTVIVGGRVEYELIRPGSCATLTQLDNAKRYVKNVGQNLSNLGKTVTFYGKDLSEALQSKGKLSFAVPGAWFLGLQIGSVFAFKLNGDSFNDFYVFIEGALEMGAKAELRLKASAIYDFLNFLASSSTWVTTIWSMIEVGKMAYQLYELAASANQKGADYGCSNGNGGGGAPRNGGAGGGRGRPPFPYSRPDDRRDAFQENFLNLPSGVSGNMQTYQQQLALAQQAGLNRAAIYWTRLLRQQEMLNFLSDTSWSITQTLEMSAALTAADLQMRGLISETIAPPPGQTITEAVHLVYDGYFETIANTSYDQRQRALQDALDFAERQYMGLVGQELELQRELRQMSNVNGLGLLDGGLVYQAIRALNSVGVPYQLVQIVPGASETMHYSSRYVPPHLAPKVMLIPSGGLYMFEGSQQARQWLDTYTAIGGTLVVMAQADSLDWTMLPGGQVRGLGYIQDILCKDASVQIINDSPYITGIGRDLPNIQVDGSFTAWPQEATIILMRTTGNKMPAMIEYPYGVGRVIAMGAYPDANLNSLESPEDLIFAKSLFSLLYLEATGQSLVASVAPGGNFSYVTTITNTTALTTTQVTVWKDYYNDGRGFWWASTANNGRQVHSEQVVGLVPPLPSGASREITVTVNAPQGSGIYRLAYNLGTPDDFYTVGAMDGPFYQVESAAVTADLLNFRLAPDQPSYPFGTTANVVATITNERDTPRNIYLQATAGFNGAAFVYLDAHSTVSYTFTTGVDRSKSLRMEALDADNGYTRISLLVAQVSMQLPSIGLTGEPEVIVGGVATSVAFTATVTNIAPGTPVEWEVRQGGSPIYSDSTPLAAGPGYQTANLDVALPATYNGDSFTVRASVSGAGALTETIPVVAPVVIESAAIRSDLQVGEENENAIIATLQDAGVSGEMTVQATLYQDYSPVTSSDPLILPFGDGYQVVTIDLPLPDALNLYSYYQVVLTASSLVDGSSAPYEEYFYLNLPVSSPSFTLADFQGAVGEPLVMHIAPQPGSVLPPTSSPYEVTLRHDDDDLNLEYSEVIAGDFSNGQVTISVTVPTSLNAGGEYAAEISTPWLVNWQESADWILPPYKLVYSADSSGVAGDSLAWTVENRGAVPTVITGSLSLVDASGLVVAEQPISLLLEPNAPITTLFALPTQLLTGPYVLRFSGQNHQGQPAGDSHRVDITGLSVSLSTQTDRPAYVSTDLVSTTSLVTTNLPLSGTTLRLQVLKPAAPEFGWDGWVDQDGDGGLTNYIDQTAFGPFAVSPFFTTDSSTSPAALDGLVYLSSYDYDLFQNELVAVDADSGSEVWAAPLPGYPYYIVANSLGVYVRTGDESLSAFDPLSGALLWSHTIADGDEPHASATALVIDSYDGSIINYALLDPATGLARAIIPSDDFNFRALLTDAFFFVVNDDEIIAYDAVSAVEVWSVPAPGNDHILLAANESYLVAAHEAVDPDTFDSIIYLDVYNAEDGGLLGQATPEEVFDVGQIEQNVVLAGDTFYYLNEVDDGGSALAPDGRGLLGKPARTLAPAGLQMEFGSYLYAVNLAGGVAISQIYFQERPIYDMMGAGQSLFVTYYDNDVDAPVVRTLNSQGNVLATQAITEPECSAGNLTASEQGLLLLGNSICLLRALQPLSSPFGSGVEVLREEWLAADGSGTFQLDLALVSPDLADDPEARGQLYLAADLFSAEPGSEADPAERQHLAGDVYPFTIDDASGSLVMNLGLPSYRTNLPSYAADDAAATVGLSGELRNTSAAPADVSLTIVRSDGATIHSESFTGVGVGESRAFTVADPTPPSGSVVYTATTSLGASTVVTALIRPALVSASASFDPNDILLGEPADFTVRVENGGDEPGFVTADWGSGPQLIELAPGELFLMTEVVTPSATGVYSRSTSFSGDASGESVASLTVGEETATAVITLTGTLRDEGGAGLLMPLAPSDLKLVQGDDAGIQFIITNPNDNDFEAIVSYALTGPVERAGSDQERLDDGDNTVNLSLGKLPVGDYTISLTVRHLELGSLIASESLSFEIVAPNYDLQAEAQIGELDFWGGLPITFISSSSADSEQPWSGVFVVRNGDHQLVRQDTFLYPGGSSFGFAYVSDWRNRAGAQSIVMTLINPDGSIALEETLYANAAPSLAPALTLTSLTAQPTSPGDLAVLEATIVNDGPAGDAVLTFVLFDQEVEQIVEVPAFGETIVTYEAATPADLIDGLYPAIVRLGERELRADLAVTGRQILVRHELDAAAYANYTTATLTVELEGVSGTDALYDVALRYGGAEYNQTVTIGAGDIVSLPWSFDVGPVSSYASVVVQTHPQEASQTRHNLVIDTQRVTVISDERLWLETDKDSYNTGDIVYLTLHVTQPTLLASVLAPDGLPGENGPLVWSTFDISQTLSITNPYTLGTFTSVFTIPTSAPTGRYYFSTLSEGENRPWPIDIHGTTLQTEQVVVSGPAEGQPFLPGDPITASANLRLDAPIASALIIMDVVDSDGNVLDLGPGAIMTTSLPAGVTPISLSAILPDSVPGSHMVTLKVYDGVAGTSYGGGARYIDVGRASLDNLTTDHGLYTPGQPGTGEVTLYGLGAADVLVTTSDGTPLLDESVALAGFETIRFTIPTVTEMDEVLIGLVTDSEGMTSTMQVAYKVASAFDTIAPLVQIIAPTTDQTIQFSSGDHSYPVTVVVTEEVEIGAVLINGLTATLVSPPTPAGVSTWTADVELEIGDNFIETYAKDETGNISLPDLINVLAEPLYGISLTVVPTTTEVNELVTVSAVISSAEAMSVTALFPFSAFSMTVEIGSGSATTGSLILTDTVVSWEGFVVPDEPVTIEWQARHTEVGERTLFAEANGFLLDTQYSNEVEVLVLPEGSTENPAISITKSPDSQVVQSGGSASFTIYVSNSGDVALTDIVFSDPLAPNCESGGPTSLGVGESDSFSCSLANVTADFTNTISVSGQSPAGATANASDTAEVDVVNPSITIAKSPDSQQIVSGGTASFTIDVTNSGDVALTGLTFGDPLAPDCENGGPTSLAAGESDSFTCSLANVTADFINTISVSGGVAGTAIVASASDTAAVDVVHPSIAITKSPDSQFVQSGGTANFTIDVSNTGDVVLTGLVFSDPLAPDCEDGGPTSLAAGESDSFTCSLVNVTADFVNTISVSGTALGSITVNASDTAAVDVVSPAISVSKSPDSQVILSGGTASFTIDVTNSGDVALTGLLFSDPLAPDCEDGGPTSLAAGKSDSFTCSLANVTADFTNTISVSGNVAGTAIVASASDTAAVDLVNPSITIAKSPDSQQIVSGGTASFTVDVTNSGDVALTGLVFSDPLAPDCEDGGPTSLAAGESASYTCSLANVTADFVNTISVSGTALGSATVNASDTAVVDVVHPGITISKSPDNQEIPSGGTATFNIQVVNSGDVALVDIVYSDPQTLDCEDGGPTSLAPGASASFTCSRENVSNGFTNTIMVTARVAGSDMTVSASDSAVVTVQSSPAPTILAFTGNGNNTVSVLYFDATPGVPFTIRFYRSADLTADGGDYLVGTATVTPVARFGVKFLTVGADLPITALEVNSDYFVLAANNDLSSSTPLVGVVKLSNQNVVYAFGLATLPDSINISLASNKVTIQLDGVNFVYSATSVNEIRLHTYGGNDTVNNNADRTLWAWGGAGNDTITGNNRTDYLYGGAGADTLRGGNGADILDGGTGADQLFGESGNDSLYAGGGGCDGDGAADFLNGGAGAGDKVYDRDPGTIDTVSNVETVVC